MYCMNQLIDGTEREPGKHQTEDSACTYADDAGLDQKGCHWRTWGPGNDACSDPEHDQSVANYHSQQE